MHTEQCSVPGALPLCSHCSPTISNVVWLSHLTHEETMASEEESLVYSHLQVSSQASRFVTTAVCLTWMMSASPQSSFPQIQMTYKVHLNAHEVTPLFQPQCVPRPGVWNKGPSWEEGSLMVGSCRPEFKSQLCPCTLLDQLLNPLMPQFPWL